MKPAKKKTPIKPKPELTNPENEWEIFDDKDGDEIFRVRRGIGNRIDIRLHEGSSTFVISPEEAKLLATALEKVVTEPTDDLTFRVIIRFDIDEVANPDEAIDYVSRIADMGFDLDRSSCEVIRLNSPLKPAAKL